MPYEHQLFHSTRLPFVSVTAVDDLGRPWSSIFAGSNGQSGFIRSPTYDKLIMDVHLWEGDPFIENAKLFGSKRMLAAGIGIEFSTRRRNKFAGHISKLDDKGDTIFHLEFEVNQAIGNCPKYINARDLIPHPDTHPTVVHRHTRLNADDRLPPELIEFIHTSDTVFLGSHYHATKEDELWFPSHVGQNQRGGRQGYIRVRPSDNRTIVLPDYSGNRLMTSLGNIEATPVASLTFVSFTTGDILYITGEAHTLIGTPALKLMPRQDVLTTIYVTGYIFVRDALPVRQRPGSEVQQSPYSPPIRLLAEEMTSNNRPKFSDDISVTLTSIDLHSNDVATFTWEASKPLSIIPGQAAILDFTDLVGAREYQHMAPFKPSSVNDDRIRTWTISSAQSFHTQAIQSRIEGTKTFSLTMREKPGGAVTGALFTISRKLKAAKPEFLKDASPLGLKVKLIGISGDFILKAPQVPSTVLVERSTMQLLWIAGGIGITPFLSMLSAIVGGSTDESSTEYDIIFLLATREPEVLLPLISRVLNLSSISANTPTASRIHLKLDVFSHNPIPSFDSPPNPDEVRMEFSPRKGRLDSKFFNELRGTDIVSRSAYLCGPEEFEKKILEMLEEVSVDRTKVRREGFEY